MTPVPGNTQLGMHVCVCVYGQRCRISALSAACEAGAVCGESGSQDVFCTPLPSASVTMQGELIRTRQERSQGWIRLAFLLFLLSLGFLFWDIHCVLVTAHLALSFRQCM